MVSPRARAPARARSQHCLIGDPTGRISSKVSALLPAWSRSLLSGVLDCQADPNLSRTDLLRSNEKEYKALKDEIESQIVRQLGLLVSYGAQWERVVSVYRLPLVYGANVNGELLRRIGHRIPFRKAVRVKGDLPGSTITLETYRVQMERRSGGEDELPIGAQLDPSNQNAVRDHQQTLYYYTGEGSLAGIIERETVLHAASNQDVALLQEWCRTNGIKAMNVGHELPFEDVRGMERFIEVVRDAIGADADRRRLQVRAVNRERCAHLRRLNPGLQLCEELTIAVGRERFHARLIPIVVHH